MSEKTSNPARDASGQSGQKSEKTKFRQESQQERLNKSKLRMEMRGSKLEAAREKLANQKPPKHPGPVKRVGRTAGRGVHGFVHGKIYQVEHENVGTEGAHRSELVGEAVVRSGVRFAKKRIRTRPARAAARAESQYAKATEKTTAATGRAVVGFVKRHPVEALILLACVLLLVVMQSCMSSMVSIGNGTVGAWAASIYPIGDGDLLVAEAAYVTMEEKLRDYLDSYESTHSYDKYHYDLGEIEHDPYNLLSILCALHKGAWTAGEVQVTLQMLFDRQYILTEDVVVERRYYIETDTWTDEEGNPHTDSYRVYYDYYICTVTLENFNLSKLPIYIMGEDQLSRYALFMATLGNRPHLFPASGYVDKYITGGPTLHEVPESYLADETSAPAPAPPAPAIRCYSWAPTVPPTCPIVGYI